MADIINFNIEGKLNPVLHYSDGNSFELPPPNSKTKQVVRQYSFLKHIRDSYPSEGNKLIEIDVKYQFKAQINWLTVSKAVLNQLFKAKNSGVINIVLNKDKSAINFNVRADFDYSYFEGQLQHPAGYTVSLTLEGSELLEKAGYESLIEAGVVGEDYGSTTGTAPH